MSYTERAISGIRLKTKRFPNIMWLLAVFVLVLVAVVLRFWGLSLESLEGDEIFSYMVASSHLSAAIATIRNDLVHPPLYYFVLRGWLDVGGHVSPLVLRIPSLFFGVSTVALVASIGWIFPQIRAAAFIAACLLAANDVHIFYSQQARSYSFYTFLVACVLIWSWQIIRFTLRFAFWCTGAILMSVLVYTHYVGALYIACIIIAITLSTAPRSAKFRIWTIGSLAALSFVPWILIELGPARQHHGSGDNLSWEGVPTFYDLKAIWGNYLGIPALPAATTCVLLIGVALAAYSIFVRRREENQFSRIFLLTLTFTAFIPPCVLFVLSLKPIALHIFGARHLLPSMVSYLLLVADGLVQLACSVRARTLVLLSGSAALLVLELVPTATSIASEPRRIPFQAIVMATHDGVPVYTTWAYGIGATMNFYEDGAQDVQGLAPDVRRLPKKFQLVFRPEIPQEEQQFEHLLQSGWKDTENRDFYNGTHSGYYVRVAQLQQSRPN